MSIDNNTSQTLFKEIDLDRTGWISYRIYFLFLKYYFGKIQGDGQINSATTIDTVVDDEESRFWNDLAGLNPFDRFVQLLLRQLKITFMRYDFNQNLLFEMD